MRFTLENLQTLCHIADLAGVEIMDVYRNGGHTWHKEDASPLTEADLRADRVIRQSLEQHFPNVFILSEESTSSNPKPQQSFFLVDPLDGTKEFLKRNDEFTVNIALIHQGQSIAGVVLAPALGELFFAAQHLGAWKRDSIGIHLIHTCTNIASAPLRIIGSRSHGAQALDAWIQRLTTTHNFVAAGSSLKFCRIAEGLADIYPRFGPTSQWDTAAGQAILEAAGGIVTDLNTQPLRYGLDQPILNPHFVAAATRELLNHHHP